MKYDLLVSWTMVDHITIEADTAREAEEQVKKSGLPTTGVYLDDSFEVDNVEVSPDQITRDRLPDETGEQYHWRQVKLEHAGLLPQTDHVGLPIEDED
jgi:hypothetical protein